MRLFALPGRLFQAAVGGVVRYAPWVVGLRDQLGHASIVTTSRYLHAEPDERPVTSHLAGVFRTGLPGGAVDRDGLFRRVHSRYP